MPRGADRLVECLYEQGVRHIFGMPGSHSTAIYDAIHLHGKIKTVLIRNEQAGAFAADGYARVTGRPGVVCTTAGPGATNALSGIAEAWSDSVPLLLLTGQVDSDRMYLECGAYHEIDLEGLFRPITRWSGVVRDVEQIPEMVRRAFDAMMAGRPQPAVLILPQDLMSGQFLGARRPEMRRNEQSVAGAESRTPPPLSPPYQGGAKGGSLRGLSPGHPLDAASIKAAADLLGRAERPILFAGGGAVWANAAAEARAVAEWLNAPVITTLSGKGLLDERDRYSLGHARSARAKAALPHADAMLAVGCRFTQVSTELWHMTMPANLVHIDLDAEQIGMNYPATVGIVADLKPALTELLRVLRTLPRPQNRWGEMWDKARMAQHPKPEWLIETLRAETPPETVLFTDASEMGLRCHGDWPAYAPRTFFYPSSYIALGWALPAAVGAAVALPETPIVSLSGDGGFLMTAQELATAARYHLRLIAIVHNDSAYGAMKSIQKNYYQERFLDVDLNNPDFVKFADAYGLPGHRATNADEFRRALRASLSHQGPSLIEVPDHWRPLRV